MRLRAMSREQKRLCACVMYSDGLPIKNAAEFLNISPYVARSAVHRLLLKGTIVDKRHPGRCSRLTNRDMRHVKLTATKGLYYSASILAKEISSDLGIALSGRHTIRLLHRFGYHRYADRAAPALTTRWRNARREFYRANLATNWKHVVFTDEKIFRLKKCGRLKYYARSFEEYQEKHHRLPHDTGKSLKVWGAISHYGVGPLFEVSKSMNCNDYTAKILAPLLSTSRQRGMLVGCSSVCPKDFLWQQDNAGFHHAKAATDFFERHNISVLKWPSYSPDLSPIENVWNMISYKLRTRQIASGTILRGKALLKAIQSEWYSITPQQCNVLVGSMPDRLNEMFRRNYGIIDY